MKTYDIDEAADFLNVSRGYVLKLLNERKLSHKMVGTHRRIRLEDLMAFKDKMHAESDAAMDELGGTRGTESMARQAQFLALRDAIEGIASDMFDTVPVVKGRIIRIFNKHIQKPSSVSDPIAADPIATGPGLDTDKTASLRVIAETRPASAAQ